MSDVRRRCASIGEKSLALKPCPRSKRLEARYPISRSGWGQKVDKAEETPDWESPMTALQISSSMSLMRRSIARGNVLACFDQLASGMPSLQQLKCFSFKLFGHCRKPCTEASGSRPISRQLGL
jgi:hypothetical protein